MIQNTIELTATRHTGGAVSSFSDLRGRVHAWLHWRPSVPREREVLSVAELADCTCPEICNRDHANE